MSHANIGKALTHSINIYNPQDVIKSKTDNPINWNFKLKLPKEIISAHKNIEVDVLRDEDIN
jgi:hypothetical protein